MIINLERQENTEIGVGNIIITRCKDYETKKYLLIDCNENDEESPNFVLIDLEHSEVRGYISSHINTVEDYIEETLEEEILEVISSNEIVISRK